jgi:hypothetical protein
MLLRMLAAAGHDESELLREQAVLFDRCARVYARHFESILARPTHELPFWHKLGEFMAQRTPTIFTSLALS